MTTSALLVHRAVLAPADEDGAGVRSLSQHDCCHAGRVNAVRNTDQPLCRHILRACELACGCQASLNAI